MLAANAPGSDSGTAVAAAAGAAPAAAAAAAVSSVFDVLLSLALDPQFISSVIFKSYDP